MDQLDREVIESLSEPAKRVFGSLDYRSRQRMLKKARAMAKEEKTRNQKKSRVKKKGIEKQNKAKRKKKGSSSKSERVLFSVYETKDLMVQSMRLMLLGSGVADNAYEERVFAHTDETQVALSRETVQKSSRMAVGGMRTLVHCRWMWDSGWMKWRTSRCRITLIRSLPPVEAVVCTVCQSYSPWHS